MSKSRKRTPAGTYCCCKSQKRGKQLSHRRFRRFERMMIQSGHDERLPIYQRELTSPWDLGGDGKHYFGKYPDEEWYQHAMRK